MISFRDTEECVLLLILQMISFRDTGECVLLLILQMISFKDTEECVLLYYWFFRWSLLGIQKSVCCYTIDSSDDLF